MIFLRRYPFWFRRPQGLTMGDNKDSLKRRNPAGESSLRRVFFLSLALIIVLPALLLALSTWMVYRREVDRVENQLQETNHQLAKLAERSLVSLIYNLADSISGSDPGRGVRREFSAAHWVDTDENRRVIKSTIPGVEAGDTLPDLFNPPWRHVEPGSDSGFDISDVVDSPDLSEPVIMIRFALSGGPMRIIIVDPDHLHSWLTSKFDSFVDRHVYAVDSSGRPIFYSNMGLIRRASVFGLNPPVRMFLARRSGPIRYVSAISKKQRVGYVLPVEEFGWGMIVSADIGERLLDIRQRMLWLLVAWASGAILAAFVFFYFSRRVIAPLIAIAEKINRADRLGEPLLELSLPGATLREINLLVTEFNEHIRKIRSSEQEVIQAEKMATLGELAAGLAHEIGTPLNVMRGNAQIMLRKLPAEHPDRESLEKIITQTGRIADLIRNMLDVARSDTAAPVAVNVKQVLSKAVATAREIHPDLHIHMSAEEALPRTPGYPRRLEHALLNIILNACQAVSKNGNIRVDAAQDAETDRIRLSVEDDGCGIDPGDLPNIFQPFFSTKGSGKGTGLGLALVDRVIREHKGQIEADSEPGKGTRFVIYLPTIIMTEDDYELGC